MVILELTQAKNLDNLLIKYGQKIDVVLKLTVSLETIKKRMSGWQLTTFNESYENKIKEGILKN